MKILLKSGGSILIDSSSSIKYGKLEFVDIKSDLKKKLLVETGVTGGTPAIDFFGKDEYIAMPEDVEFALNTLQEGYDIVGDYRRIKTDYDRSVIY